MYSDEQRIVLLQIEELLGKKAVENISSLLDQAKPSTMSALFGRIQKNLTYLTIVRKRGDYYHSLFTSPDFEFHSKYKDVLSHMPVNYPVGEIEDTQSLMELKLSEDVSTIIFLGDGHVLGEEFIAALCPKNNLGDLLLDISEDTLNIVNGRERSKIIQTNPNYQNSTLLNFISGRVLIAQTGDNLYPSVIEHYILMCLRVLGGNFVSIMGDNDLFLLLQNNELDSISDMIASTIMKHSLEKEVNGDRELLNLIHREIKARPASLLITQEGSAVGLSHKGMYDIHAASKGSDVYGENELLSVGIHDQVMSIDSTEKYLNDLSSQLNKKIVGWVHGSDSSNELRKIQNAEEVKLGIFKLGNRRFWIADNKQDPLEHTSYVELNVKNGLQDFLLGAN